MLTIKTLGKFQIIGESGIVLDDDMIRSTMLTKLLVFLVLHRGQTLTTDDIAAALWQEEEIENPAGALKNLMYRLRNLLKKQFGDTEFVLTNRGSYCWNTEVEIVLDAEEFEKAIEMAGREDISDSEAISCYERALAMYHGDFMPKICEMHWVVTRSAYYHSMFLSAIKGLAELYIKSEQFEKMEEICNEALRYDSVDEQLHYYLILARMRQNKLGLAMESYEKACRILYEELGIRKPEMLQKIYEELLQMNKGKTAENIEQVQEDMTEEETEGAFFCGYPVFREIYRLEARKITRVGEAEFILLLTFKTENDGTDKAEAFRIRKAMEKMTANLKSCLRIGDVVARYSDSQFIVLLSSCNYENGRMVADRIVSQFYAENPKMKQMEIDINLEEVMAADFLVK